MRKYTSIPRIYYHYELWEEYKFGMWINITGIEAEYMLNKAIIFTGNALKYGRYMNKVLELWPISCLVNLSNINMNRQAWIGHAACCIAIGCPESITRAAWHYLTENQQNDANKQADNAIDLWECNFLKGYQLCLNLI